MQMNILTNTAATTLCRCARLFYWRYERCIRPARDDDAENRETGSLMHVGADAYAANGLVAGVAAIDQWEAAQPAIGEQVTKIEQRAAKARAMLRAIDIIWPRSAGSAERIVSMPIVNPDTGAASRTFVYRGKSDKLEGSRIIDWKGTSDPADFIRKAVRSYQVELYAEAARHEGLTVDCLEYRLITFPTIKLCGKDADAAAYEKRCLDWLMANGGRDKLVVHELFVNPARVELAKAWLWDVSKQILDNRRTGRWFMNASACMTWNRICPYNSICNVIDNGGNPEDLIGSMYEAAEPNPELCCDTE